MKVSDLLVECLVTEGVEYIFGIPGEEILDVVDSLSQSRISFVPTRHEQGAAFMANVYGRLTGKPGVCLSTLGPGATNLTTGVADALLDRVPLLAITGQASLDKLYKESHQRIDIIEMFKPITKWNARVELPSILPELVAEAFKIAQAEKPGATHIELPEDVAAMETSAVPLRSKTTGQYARPNPSSIRAAANIIEQADYPIILAGNGVIRRRASKQLTELAQKLQIPVIQTFMGAGSIDYRNPLCLLTVGLQSNDWVMCGLDRADVVIAVGYDPVEYAPKSWNADKQKRIIHIDASPSEVDEYYLPEVEIVAEIGNTLEGLAKTCQVTAGRLIHDELRQHVLGELEEYREDQSFPLKPQKVVGDLRKALGEDDILISDVGAHKLWIARMYPANKPNTVLISNGFASMGFAVPGAIATKIVYPERKVVAVSGDGGFLMNSQELETAKRLQLAFVTVVWVDYRYGLIEWRQMNKFGRTFGVNFGNPDFVKYAEAFGLPAFAIGHSREFLPTLRKALELELPSLIEVPIDYRENMRLTEKLGQVTCTI